MSGAFLHWTHYDANMCPKLDTCPIQKGTRHKLHPIFNTIKKEKKKNDIVVDVFQLEHNNNKCYTSVYIYIYIYDNHILIIIHSSYTHYHVTENCVFRT